MAIDRERSMRENDLVLSPGEYAYISDTNSGRLTVLVGPKKETLTNTDQPVKYNAETRQYERCTVFDAICQFPYADENSYIILENPATTEAEVHPKISETNKTVELKHGQKVNIEGPATFALWPGQKAVVLQGHRLRSNQYLLVRVVNDKVAKENWEKTVVKSAEGGSDTNNKKSSQKIKDFNLTTGALNIIKGTDVSFYIPPTGIEVVSDENNNYVRDALTLERLQYCILVDESGDKRYVIGPDVVFPKPTENFVCRSKKSENKKYKAVELNENMGLYIKVIADYKSEPDASGVVTTIKAGDELFITGKEQKIYFPREEHAVVKYGDQMIHYAVAIPKGEALYVLNKKTGSVETVKGPNMFLPNPIVQVVVKRMLEDKQVNLWFPGNIEALAYNKSLREKERGDMGFVEGDSRAKSRGDSGGQYSRSTVRFNDQYAEDDDFSDGMTRNTTFMPPRTITLDTKYSGAVMINVWPGYAIQIVNKTGERRVVEGPKAVILEYDETLESMSMSTGKPKNEAKIIQTSYLKVSNNKVSDLVSAKTKDLVDVQLELSYKVNFEGDNTKWFSVDNYVKYLTDNCRSIIRNEIKKHGIEAFITNAEDIVRNIIVGVSVQNAAEVKGRPGRKFDENGMRIYDVDVLNIEIGDSTIAHMITQAQHGVVRSTLELKNTQQDLIVTTEIESAKQQKANLIDATAAVVDSVEKNKVQRKIEREQMEIEADRAKQAAFNELATARLSRTKDKADLENIINKERIDMESNGFTKKMTAFTPQLIQALVTSGQHALAQALVQQLPKADMDTVRVLFGTNNPAQILDSVQKGLANSVVEKFTVSDDLVSESKKTRE